MVAGKRRRGHIGGNTRRRGLWPTNTHFTSSCFLSSAGIFLASSAAMIGVVVLVRRTVVAIQNRGASDGGSSSACRGSGLGKLV
jgi:hypothetical protein